jgi:hypothetical protein
MKLEKRTGLLGLDPHYKTIKFRLQGLDGGLGDKSSQSTNYTR